jgi:hypothetical protein
VTETPGPELLETHVRTLFALDGDGKLAAINEPLPQRPAPPRVFVARTADAVAVHVRADVPPTTEAAVRAAIAAVPPCRPGEPSGITAALGPLLAADAPVTRTSEGPAFLFADALFGGFGALKLYPANAALLHPELATWGPELRYRRPAFAVVRDRQAVAICASARISPEAAEAGVETVAAYRGQGCAQVAVEAWAAAIRESGRVPFYSTSWGNAASRAVARKLALIPFAEDAWLD